MTLHKRIYKQYTIFVLIFIVTLIFLIAMIVRGFENNIFNHFVNSIVQKAEDGLNFEELMFDPKTKLFTVNYLESENFQKENYTKKSESNLIESKDNLPEKLTAKEIFQINKKDEGSYANSIYIDEKQNVAFIQFPNSGIIYRFEFAEYIIKTVILFVVILLLVVILLFGVIITMALNKLITQIARPIEGINENLRAIKELDFSKIKNVNYNYNLKEIDELISSSKQVEIFLREYISEKTTLTSALMHEIRGPLTTIKNLMIGYKEKIPPFNDEEFFVEQLEDKIDDLEKISKYILEVFEMSNSDKELINFNDKIKRGLIDQKISFDIQNLNVEIKENAEFCTLCSNEVAELIISNILNNISRYAKEDTNVSIIINENNIYFINKKNAKRGLGTQKGMLLSSQQLAKFNLGLFYSSINDEYLISIEKKEQL